MREYGYLIYKDYCIDVNERYLDYQDYMDKFLIHLHKDVHIQRKWVKHMIFVIAVVGLIYFLYKNK